tara:strand:- start:3468 stop:4082 length:615 start_codon:yes stop_codon:yes gene_type:complete
MAEESPVNEFQTITNSGESLFKDKGSKFIGLAYPVETEEAVKEKLEEIKKQYYDARHYCYAYILGLKDQSYRANDDGEPNHSAGDPILGQIRSANLTNTLVVVVRYFGGTKLGIGGLINAYKTAAEEALNKTTKKLIYSKTTFRLTFQYPQTSEVERILSEFEVEYHQKDYTDHCHFLASVKDEDIKPLSSKLELVSGVVFKVV